MNPLPLDLLLDTAAARKLHRQWLDLARRLQLPDAVADEVFVKIDVLYSIPRRAYHSLDHVAQCLRDFDLVRDECEYSGVVETALWFHDAVYVPRLKDNEERSAVLATKILQVLGLGSDFADRVADLIRVTRHDRPPRTPDEAVILDVDLAILGAPPARYNRYERGIREEYDWVSEPEFREARAAILQGFLDRTHIYNIALFRERYEDRARENLTRSIKRLRRSPKDRATGDS